MSCLQQLSNVTEERYQQLMSGEIGGLKTKIKKLIKKIQEDSFFFFPLFFCFFFFNACAWCNNSQEKNEDRKTTAFYKPKFDYA